MNTQDIVKITPNWIYAAVSTLLAVVYFAGIRRLLSNGTASAIELGALALLILLAFGGLITGLISLVRAGFAGENAHWIVVRDRFVFAGISAALLAGMVWASQLQAHTPVIRGTDGEPLPGSIASLEKIQLGGEEQWLILRGQDVNKPVLLFLSGGPGASEAARVLRFNAELEEEFVVAVWEQRGCGKSYPLNQSRQELTVDLYTQDVIELAEILRERFDEEKIYLVGHSWGTIIGTYAAQARPDLFHAYIGTAQMVDVRETDQLIYDIVMEESKRRGDDDFVNTLLEQGPPPYTGKNPIAPYSTLFGREYALFEVPNIRNDEYRREGDILMLMLKQPEYGWLDRVHYLLGMMNTFNVVYPQLQDLDFRSEAVEFEVPVYIILGRHDMNNPLQIPEEYFELIEAPEKELVIFEHSGHGMIWEEADLYHSLLSEKVVPGTYH